MLSARPSTLTTITDRRPAAAPPPAPEAQKHSLFGWSSGVRQKQDILDRFGTFLAQPDVSAAALHVGLIYAIHDIHDGYFSDAEWSVLGSCADLMKHRVQKGSLHCTESGIVAILSIVVRLCGPALCEPPRVLSWPKIEMALQLLIGKHPQLIADISRFYHKESETAAPSCFVWRDSQIRVRSSSYSCTFPFPDGPHPQLAGLISDQHFGHSFFARTPQADVVRMGTELGVVAAPQFAQLREASGKLTPRVIRRPVAADIIACHDMMTAGRVFYDREVGGARMTLSYPCASNSVLLNKAPEAELDAIGARILDPIHFYRMSFRYTEPGTTDVETVDAFCCAALGGMKFHKESSVEQARRILQTMFPSRVSAASAVPFAASADAVRYPGMGAGQDEELLVDLRFLRMFDWGGANDPKLFIDHQNTLQIAAEEMGVQVFSIFCHVASDAREEMAHPLSKSPPPVAREMLAELTDVLRERFERLDEEQKRIYRPFFTKWLELSQGLTHLDNAIPFASLTLILQRVLNFKVLMGCRSAKDRTGAIIMGANMFLSLLLSEIIRNRGVWTDVSSFFRTKDGRLNWLALSAEQRMLLTLLYDEKLLHIFNFINLGVWTNVGPDTLLRFFAQVPCVAESQPRTLGVHA